MGALLVPPARLGRSPAGWGPERCCKLAPTRAGQVAGAPLDHPVAIIIGWRPLWRTLYHRRSGGVFSEARRRIGNRTDWARKTASLPCMAQVGKMTPSRVASQVHSPRHGPLATPAGASLWLPPPPGSVVYLSPSSALRSRLPFFRFRRRRPSLFRLSLSRSAMASASRRPLRSANRRCSKTKSPRRVEAGRSSGDIARPRFVGCADFCGCVLYILYTQR